MTNELDNNDYRSETEIFDRPDRCPICYNMSLVGHVTETGKDLRHCPDCGYSAGADESNDETPLGEQIDGGNDHVEDEVAEDHGWPGDGSGEDDLADFNANEADDYRDE